MTRKEQAEVYRNAARVIGGMDVPYCRRGLSTYPRRAVDSSEWEQAAIWGAFSVLNAIANEFEKDPTP